jgi:hypothetical protein
MKTAEEAAAIPHDKSVLIEIEAAPSAEMPEIAVPEKVVEPAVTDPGHTHQLSPAPAPVPEPDPEPAEDDVNVLKKQLEDFNKAQDLSKRQLAEANARADAAQRQARERDQELTVERSRTAQVGYDAVLSRIAAAQAETDKAQSDLETSLAAQDYRSVAEAQRRLSMATTVLVRSEDEKAAWEQHRDQVVRTAPQTSGSNDPIDTMSSLSNRQRDWLKQHRDAFDNPSKNARLGAAHWDAVEAGHAQDSDGYFQVLEERLGYRRVAANPAPSNESTYRSPPVSAPVSRSTPSPSTGRPTSTRVELSPAQREAARISGVDEFTYAKGVIELENRKKQGMYPDR